MLARVQLTGAPRGASGVYVRAHAAKYYTLLNPPSGGAMVMYQHTQKVGFMWLGGLLLVLVTFLVGLLLIRTGLAISNKEICAEES